MRYLLVISLNKWKLSQKCTRIYHQQQRRVQSHRATVRNQKDLNRLMREKTRWVTCKMWVPWCCSNSSRAKLAADLRAALLEIPKIKMRWGWNKIESNKLKLLYQENCIIIVLLVFHINVNEIFNEDFHLIMKTKGWTVHQLNPFIIV